MTTQKEDPKVALVASTTKGAVEMLEVKARKWVWGIFGTIVAAAFGVGTAVANLDNSIENIDDYGSGFAQKQAQKQAALVDDHEKRIIKVEEAVKRIPEIEKKIDRLLERVR